MSSSPTRIASTIVSGRLGPGTMPIFTNRKLSMTRSSTFTTIRSVAVPVAHATDWLWLSARDCAGLGHPHVTVDRTLPSLHPDGQ